MPNAAPPAHHADRTSRAWFWLQLIIGWLPVWALFTTLLLTAHPAITPSGAFFVATRLIVAAIPLAFLVRRVTARLPWPYPFRLRFVALHLAGAALFASAWLLLNSLIASALHGTPLMAIGYGLGPFLILGVWLYVMIAGVLYATQATERAARAEAMAAQSQLAALRAQLNPHFLFNALHSVVQLIPRDAPGATRAAEQLAVLLRSTIEGAGDITSLAEERAFVERYLELERLRFADRLDVRIDVSVDAERATLPSFALLTLVENAVRHGAAPRVEPTHLTILGRASDHELRLTVHDDGAGADEERLRDSSGTGLTRLRQRLAVLYGSGAQLEVKSAAGAGFTASLVIPQEEP